MEAQTDFLAYSESVLLMLRITVSLVIVSSYNVFVEFC